MIDLRQRQDTYVQQLIAEIDPEHVAEALMMRTTIKDLKLCLSPSEFYNHGNWSWNHIQ